MIRTICQYIAIFCCLLGSFAAPAQVYASQELELHDFVLDNSEGNLLLRFGIGVSSLDSLRVLLKEGGTVKLECEGTLSLRKELWLDGTVASRTLISFLRYDKLTQEYVMQQEGVSAPFSQKSLKQLLQNTWGRLSLPLTPLEALDRGAPYVVSLHVILHDEDVAPWLKKTLFFWSWDAAPSMRYSMDFIF